MAVLPDEDREALTAEFMRDLSSRNISAPNCLKADVRAAVNATDDWSEANAPSFNAALPPAVRNNINTKEKTYLLRRVIARRAEVL